MTVLVTGPAGAGVSSLVTALRERMPAAGVVDEAAEPPDAVVFAVSAVAPLTESDCAVLDGAAARTDLVIAVLTKIDIHHRWRDVLTADRGIVGRRAARYAQLPWLGVAAAPEFGAPRLDELVALLARRLADPATEQRNRRRREEADPQRDRPGHDAAVADRATRVAALRRRRDTIRREARLGRAHRGVALRGELQRARVELLHGVRTRCTALRAELTDEVGGLGRRGLASFEECVRARADEVCGTVGAEVSARLAEVAAALQLPCPPAAEPVAAPDLAGPPLHRRRLESRLMTLLGAGFGLGVALGVSRLLSGLDPRMGLAGLVAGAVAGLVVSVWVVGIRGLLQDRAVLDRWVAEVTASVRSAAEETVAGAVVAAESALTCALVAVEETAAARAAEQLADIDARLRALAAAADRDRKEGPPPRR